MEERELPRAVLPATTAIFAALHAALASFPGPLFRSWMFFIMPIEGIVLGPGPGAVAAIIGGSIGCFNRGEAMILPIVALSEPVGAASAGLAFRGRWRELLGLYGLMLAAYFIHPLGRQLPAWCLWDIYIAFAAIGPACLISGRLARREKLRAPELPLAVALSTFVGLEADVLTRIFMLIPMFFYTILVPEPVIETLTAWWIAGAFTTPIEALLGVAFSAWVVPPVLVALEQKGIRCPMT